MGYEGWHFRLNDKAKVKLPLLKDCPLTKEPMKVGKQDVQITKLPENVVSGHTQTQELVDAAIECEAGQGVTYIKKTAMTETVIPTFAYQCVNIPGLGACTPGQTPQA